MIFSVSLLQKAAFSYNVRGFGYKPQQKDGHICLVTEQKKEETIYLAGKTAIVTGSNTGIGDETALDLYQKGAKVYVACRSEERALKAIGRMKAKGRTGELIFGHLDLASPQSVQDFSEKVLARESHLDLLVNNAGVMIPPPSKSADGFEIQFGINFVGHFALTGHLHYRWGLPVWVDLQ